MSGAKKDGADRWKGEVYNSENGKTYSGYVTVKSKDEVKLEGCVLTIPFASRTSGAARNKCPGGWLAFLNEAGCPLSQPGAPRPARFRTKTKPMTIFAVAAKAMPRYRACPSSQ